MRGKRGFLAAAVGLVALVLTTPVQGLESELRLAIKYVAFIDPGTSPGEAVVSQSDAVRNLQAINRLWGACSISFQLEKYQALKPSDYGLPYQLSEFKDLDQIREKLEEPNSLLIVTTGPWERRGSLGRSSANAWTPLPLSGPFGVILEKPVATYPNIIAHELGHYLNLRHVTDDHDLMNATIYTRSTVVRPDQCETARQVAVSQWANMLR